MKNKGGGGGKTPGGSVWAANQYAFIHGTAAHQSRRVCLWQPIR
jgi:hypothetical protein